jgi:hypothetical protein
MVLTAHDIDAVHVLEKLRAPPAALESALPDQTLTDWRDAVEVSTLLVRVSSLADVDHERIRLAVSEVVGEAARRLGEDDLKSVVDGVGSPERQAIVTAYLAERDRVLRGGPEWTPERRRAMCEWKTALAVEKFVGSPSAEAWPPPCRSSTAPK